jgi:hypothetical protein
VGYGGYLALAHKKRFFVCMQGGGREGGGFWGSGWGQCRGARFLGSRSDSVPGCCFQGLWFAV